MPHAHDNGLEAAAPVHITDTGSAFDRADLPESGMALCLSGGGYRAMLFHLGALWRLNEWGYLPRLTRVSSVSGGSITAGVLGLKWATLGLDAEGVGGNFDADVVQPIRAIAGKTIDEGSILSGIVLPGSIADKVVERYREHLFGRPRCRRYRRPRCSSSTPRMFRVARSGGSPPPTWPTTGWAW